MRENLTENTLIQRGGEDGLRAGDRAAFIHWRRQWPHSALPGESRGQELVSHLWGKTRKSDKTGGLAAAAELLFRQMSFSMFRFRGNLDKVTILRILLELLRKDL